MSRVVNKKHQKPGKSGVVKKKAKRKAEIEKVFSPKAQKRFEGEAENALIDAEEAAQARYDWAKGIKELQDDKTQVAINRMVAQMARMAGPPVFTYKGVTLNVEEDRIKRIHYFTQLWIAVRLLAACAEWDIQIENYTPPKKRCAKCARKPA